MSVPVFSQGEQMAVSRAFAWADKEWDWEMPTLIGLEHGQFRTAAAAWSQTAAEAENASALAAIGAVREFWSAHRDAAPLLGLSPDQIKELLRKLAEAVDAASNKSLGRDTPLQKAASRQVWRARQLQRYAAP